MLASGYLNSWYPAQNQYLAIPHFRRASTSKVQNEKLLHAANSYSRLCFFLAGGCMASELMQQSVSSRFCLTRDYYKLGRVPQNASRWEPLGITEAGFFYRSDALSDWPMFHLSAEFCQNQSSSFLIYLTDADANFLGGGSNKWAAYWEWKDARQEERADHHLVTKQQHRADNRPCLQWNTATLSHTRVGLDQRSCSTSSPVSTGTGDCLQAGKLSHYVTSHPGQLSLSSFRGR